MTAEGWGKTVASIYHVICQSSSVSLRVSLIHAIWSQRSREQSWQPLTAGFTSKQCCLLPDRITTLRSFKWSSETFIVLLLSQTSLSSFFHRCQPGGETPQLTFHFSFIMVDMVAWMMFLFMTLKQVFIHMINWTYIYTLMKPWEPKMLWNELSLFFPAVMLLPVEADNHPEEQQRNELIHSCRQQRER